MTGKSHHLPQVQLGADGPLIGALGLGCMGMSEFYGASDEDESRATLERALELGVTMFDTADMYGMGANEEFLAPFVTAHRDRVLIATKFGYARTRERPDDWSLDTGPNSSVRRWTGRCDASASTRSISIICIAAIPRCRSRNRSARWRS